MTLDPGLEFVISFMRVSRAVNRFSNAPCAERSVVTVLAEIQSCWLDSGVENSPRFTRVTHRFGSAIQGQVFEVHVNAIVSLFR